MSKLVLKIIRALIGFGSFVTPKLAGLVAFRLFCTPLKVSPKNKKTIERIKNGECTLKTGEKLQLDFPGGKIVAYQFNNTASKTVVLVHGFQSRASYMAGFIGPLVDQGFRVIAFDLPAHGLSCGKRCHVPIAVAALNAVHKYSGPWQAVISHSLGSVVTATLLSRTMPAYSKEIPVSRLVMISSPNSVPQLFQNFVDLIGLRGRATEVFFSMINKLSDCQPEDFMTANQVKRIGRPTLVLHAPDDKEIPFSDAEEIARNNSNVYLKPIPRMGHRRIVWSDTTINEAVKFITHAA